MINLFRFFNTLSFDTALGAISFAYIISYTQQVEIDLSIYAALFVSVLSIYNIDHLIDAGMLQNDAKSYRHSFYQNHRKLLFLWQFILTGIGFTVLFYLPIQILWAGVSLLALIGIYFWIIFSFSKTSWILREVIVAFGYTTAVAFLPIFEFKLEFNLSFFWLFSIIFFIALCNLWVFSLFDIEIDKSQKHHSIARSVKPLHMKNLVRATAFITVVLTVAFTFYFSSFILGGALIITVLTYLILLENHAFFSKHEYYRLIGETVLVLPGALLLVTNAI